MQPFAWSGIVAVEKASASRLWQSSWTTDDAIQAALDWLEDEDWLRSEATGGTGPGSGRRTLRYRIHPAIKGKRKGGDA